MPAAALHPMVFLSRKSSITAKYCQPPANRLYPKPVFLPGYTRKNRWLADFPPFEGRDWNPLF
jgi:hypothetical protein